jgi:hypothetical protein
VTGAAVGERLHLAFPVQMPSIARLSRDHLLTLNPRPGTISPETNAAYQPPAASAALVAVPNSALDTASGEKLFGQQLGGPIGGGVITYAVNGAQKVAVAYGFSMLAWPVKVVTAKIMIMGVDGAAAAP